MTLDQETLALVHGMTRSLSSRDVDGTLARVLVAERTFAAPRADVWDALTNGERIPKWFLPISGDLRVGGRYQFQGNAGGEILACEAPSRLAVTWEMHGSPSWLTITLAEAPNGTRFQLEHVAHVPEEFWNQYGPGAVGVGWDMALLLGLTKHLASGGVAVDSAAVMAWVASDEGKAFVRASSEAWGEASIAGGTDAESARSAAGRTTAFYGA